MTLIGWHCSNDDESDDDESDDDESDDGEGEGVGVEGESVGDEDEDEIDGEGEGGGFPQVPNDSEGDSQTTIVCMLRHSIRMARANTARNNANRIVGFKRKDDFSFTGANASIEDILQVKSYLKSDSCI
jgi:hypothetical protein